METIAPVELTKQSPAPVCPDCTAPVVRASGCVYCPACGWGKCQ